MVEAKALFKRHIKEFQEANPGRMIALQDAPIIYAACILAEAIRKDFDEAKVEICVPKAEAPLI